MSEEKIDILYEIRYSSFMMQSILSQFDETVCYTLYGTDCVNVWSKFSDNRHNLAVFLSSLSPDQKQKFLKWVTESVDINLIKTAAKGVEPFIPPVPKKFFLDPKMARDQKRQLIKMKMNIPRPRPQPQPPIPQPQPPIPQPRLQTRPQPIMSGHSIKTTNKPQIPPEMNDFLKRQLHNNDNPLRQAFFTKLERARKKGI